MAGNSRFLGADLSNRAGAGGLLPDSRLPSRLPLARGEPFDLDLGAIAYTRAAGYAVAFAMDLSFRLISIPLVVVGLSLLTACAGDSTAIPQAQCHAVGAQAWLGQTASEQAIDKAMVSAGAMRSRVIRPGAPVTQELDPLRLNIMVDEAGRIRRMQCG